MNRRSFIKRALVVVGAVPLIRFFSPGGSIGGCAASQPVLFEAESATQIITENPDGFWGRSAIENQQWYQDRVNEACSADISLLNGMGDDEIQKWMNDASKAMVKSFDETVLRAVNG